MARQRLRQPRCKRNRLERVGTRSRWRSRWKSPKRMPSAETVKLAIAGQPRSGGTFLPDTPIKRGFSGNTFKTTLVCRVAPPSRHPQQLTNRNPSNRRVINIKHGLKPVTSLRLSWLLGPAEAYLLDGECGHKTAALTRMPPGGAVHSKTTSTSKRQTGAAAANPNFLERPWSCLTSGLTPCSYSRRRRPEED